MMKAYTQQLTKEMEEVENKWLTTEKGYQVRFAMKLIPSDMCLQPSHPFNINTKCTFI